MAKVTVRRYVASWSLDLEVLIPVDDLNTDPTEELIDMFNSMRTQDKVDDLYMVDSAEYFDTYDVDEEELA